MATRIVPVLLCLFLLSGASALILEMLWQRQLILVLGATATATSAIMTAFFVGLALGSWLGGKLLARWKNPLMFYGCVELWIGVWALAFPLLLPLLEHAYVAMGAHTAAFYPRFFLTILIILPATLGMGATIPVMNRLISDNRESIGTSVALAYGINALGAALGCLAAGFLLIPQLGLSATLYGAVALNFLVALIAFSMSKSLPLVRASEKKYSPAPYVWVYGSLYFLSGFLALGYQITWLRMLAILASGSIVTFTLSLVVFITGFSCGSAILYPYLARRLRAQTMYALSFVGTGLTILATFPLYYRFPLLTDLYQKAEPSLWNFMLLESTISMGMMFVPTLFMGLAYPAVCALLVKERTSLAEQSGFLYFLGTLGSAVGAAVVGLWLIPWLGLPSMLFSLVGIGCAVGVWIWVRGDKRKIFIGGALLAAMFFACIATVHHALPLVRDGAIAEIEGKQWESKRTPPQKNQELLHYRTGRNATVGVKEAPSSGARVLTIDDQVVAGSAIAALVDSKILAHLPLLLHPNPKSALTVGFGSGGTSWSMLIHGIETWVVEIEPEVLKAAKYFTKQNNHGVLERPELNIALDDARHFLSVSGRTFDVISTDVTNIQYKQNASLYTQDYFQILKNHLSEGGIACAWIPMTGISDKDFKTLLRTFQSVFPHSSLWIMQHTKTYYAVLIGTPAELSISRSRLKKGFANLAVRTDLKEVKIDKPEMFKEFLFLDEDGYRDYVGPGVLHTDNLPVLEFSTPRYFYGGHKDFEEKLSEMRHYKPKSIKITP